MLDYIANSTVSQAKQRYNAAVSNFFGKNEFGGIQKIGKENVYDIFSKVTEFEKVIEHKYSEQAGIGGKASLTYSGEELKKYSLPIKLHASFCDPDDIIKRLEEKAELKEVFPFYLNGRYEGQYVVNKVQSRIIDTIYGATVYAQITVDLIEDAQPDEEYEQQTITTVTFDGSDIKDSANSVKTPVEIIKNEGKNIFDKLTDKVIKEATRTADGYINSNLWGAL